MKDEDQAGKLQAVICSCQLLSFPPSLPPSLPPSEGGSQASPEGERDRGSREEREAPSEGRKKRPRLFQNPQALQEIKSLWEGGQRNQAEIARAIGYDRATVNDNIRKMIKAGELSPKDQ